MPSEKKTVSRPNLSTLAIISFISSFAIARIFTTLAPNVVVISGGFHIHHFFYGLVLLAIGGWLGISYVNEQIDRLAAILFGAGGGLIVDEVGLLLTFGDYWTGITYMFLVIFLALVFMLTLLARYSKTIIREFSEFLRSNASLYIGIFLTAISIAFIMKTDNMTIVTISSLLAIVSCIIILAYFIQRIRKRH